METNTRGDEYKLIKSLWVLERALMPAHVIGDVEGSGCWYTVIQEVKHPLKYKKGRFWNMFLAHVYNRFLLWRVNIANEGEKSIFTHRKTYNLTYLLWPDLNKWVISTCCKPLSVCLCCVSIFSLGVVVGLSLCKKEHALVFLYLSRRAV